MIRFSRLLVLAALVGSPFVLAERADRQKPMNIEADALRYDEVRQVSVFTGKVVLTKGTMVIRAARVEVKQDAEGHQFGVATAEPGARAFFRQKREGVDEYIEGEGELIDYDGRADVVKFIRRAEMRRFRGATLSDEVSGNLVVYDNTRDVFTVDGRAVAGANLPPTRVRAVMTPTPTPTSGGSPAEAPAGAAVPLKSTPALREGSR